MAHVLEQFVDVFGVYIEHAVQLRSQRRRRGQCVPQVGHRLVQVGAILADEGVDALQRRVRLSDGLVKLIEQRPYLRAGGIEVAQRGFNLRPVLLQYSVRVGKAAGEAPPVLRVEEVVDALHCDLEFGGALVQRGDEIFRFRPQSVELGGDGVEVDVGLRRQRGAGCRASLPRASRGELQVILAERAQAQDRKSTRLNSSHGYISYAVFCLKKKKNKKHTTQYE